MIHKKISLLIFIVFLYSNLSYSEGYGLNFVSDVSLLYPKISNFQDIKKESGGEYISRLKKILDIYDLGVSNYEIKDFSRKGCSLEGLYLSLRYQEKVAGDIVQCFTSGCESHEINRIKYKGTSERVSEELSECKRALDLN